MSKEQYQKHSQDLQFQFSLQEEEKKRIQNLLNKLDFQKNYTVFKFSYSSLNTQGLLYLLKSSVNIINLSIIKQVRLDGNKLCDNSIKQLFRKKYKWISLQQLYLSENNITIKGVQYLSKGAQIRLFPQLSILQLGSNHIGDQDAEQIENHKQQSKVNGFLLQFANQNTKLSQLSLSSNNINDKTMLRLFNFRENSITNNDYRIFYNLQIISLSYNNLIKDGLKVFARKLQQCYPSLRQLYLHQNKINKDGVKYLLDYNNKNQNYLSKLQKLSLDNNNLCFQAVKILVPNKFVFRNLKRLWVSDNFFIGDKGVQYLIKACQQGAFPLLQALNVSNVNMSNRGIEYIIKKYHPIKTLTKLQQFGLDYNQKLVSLEVIMKNLSKRFKPQIQISLESD